MSLGPMSRGGLHPHTTRGSMGLLAARAGKRWPLLSAQWELERQVGVRSQSASRAVMSLY